MQYGQLIDIVIIISIENKYIEFTFQFEALFYVYL